MHFFQKTQLPERSGGKFRRDFNRTFYPKEQITTGAFIESRSCKKVYLVNASSLSLLPRQTRRQVLYSVRRAHRLYCSSSTMPFTTSAPP